ncbi:hypothetical protein V6N12_011198 [Hibiscus sabdariffa]|uniref:Uncharacterized protein n=1 Tax=Hibiscus sabdariffa TaxID=183260 RepID=A0ABR2EMA9_9ROSI
MPASQVAKPPLGAIPFGEKTSPFFFCGAIVSGSTVLAISKLENEHHLPWTLGCIGTSGGMGTVNQFGHKRR